MDLPVPRDMEPMLSLLEPRLPVGAGWEYEPKWDGFRVLAFRDGDQVELMSRGARPMTRYFPELVPAMRELTADRFVLDGEVILIGTDGLDFDALLQRVHPAESRIKMLSRTTPASYVAFDALVVDGEDLRGHALADRRVRLERLLEQRPDAIHLTPATEDAVLAAEWFDKFEGAGLDGLIAKRLEQPYLAGKRGWVKIKHERTADCVVIGFRWSKDGSSLGSLLLGLYDAEGELHYVGHTSSFSAAEKKVVLAKLEPLRTEVVIDHGRMPGGPSRWSRGRESEWVSLRPELVCEVAFDKLQSGWRFRHAAGFRRWRPDKPPSECAFDQIADVAHFDVAEILRT